MNVTSHILGPMLDPLRLVILQTTRIDRTNSKLFFFMQPNELSLHCQVPRQACCIDEIFMCHSSFTKMAEFDLAEEPVGAE